MERRASHGQASSRIVEHGSPGMLERLYQQREQQGHGSTHSPRTSEDDGTLQALSQKVRMQKSEIETLTTELQVGHGCPHVAAAGTAYGCRAAPSVLRSVPSGHDSSVWIEHHRPFTQLPLYLHMQAANSKRTDLAKQAAALSQRLVESEIRVSYWSSAAPLCPV